MDLLCLLPEMLESFRSSCGLIRNSFFSPCKVIMMQSGGVLVWDLIALLSESQLPFGNRSEAAGV